jgi:hypothetical protein
MPPQACIHGFLSKSRIVGWVRNVGHVSRTQRGVTHHFFLGASIYPKPCWSESPAMKTFSGQNYPEFCFIFIDFLGVWSTIQASPRFL